jgi:hypothetical protein
MKTLPANYSAAVALRQQKPVIVVSFLSIADEFFATGNFADITGAYRKDIVEVQITQHDSDLIESSFSRTSATIEINNDAGAFAFLKNRLVFSDTIIIKQGFSNLVLADFIPIFCGTVDSIGFNTQNDSFTVVASDLTPLLSRPIFLAGYTTKLNGAITNVATTATLVKADNLPDPTTLQTVRDNVKTAVIIDNELILYGAINYGTEGLSSMTRGFFDTAAAHADQATVTAAMCWLCDPMHMLLTILCTTNTTTSGGKQNAFDLGAPLINAADRRNDWLLNFSKDNVDVKGIERLGLRLWEHKSQMDFAGTSGQGRVFRVIKDQEANALNFISSLLYATGCALVPGPPLANKPTVKVISFDYVNILESTPVTTLTDADLTIENMSYVSDISYLLNRIHSLQLFIPATGGHALDFVWNNANSQSQYFVAERSGDYLEQGYPGEIFAPGSDDVNRFKRRLATRNAHLFELAAKLQLSMPGQRGLTFDIGDLFELNITGIFPHVNEIIARNPRAILVGYTYSFRSGRTDLSFISFDYYGRVHNVTATPYTINKVTGGSINDSTTALSATETATIEAADAFDDNASNFTANAILFRITITPPATPAGVEGWITLKVSSIVAAAFVAEHRVNKVRVVAGESAFVVDLLLCCQSTHTPDDVKLDFIESTFVSPQATVVLNEVWYIVLNLIVA